MTKTTKDLGTGVVNIKRKHERCFIIYSPHFIKNHLIFLVACSSLSVYSTLHSFSLPHVVSNFIIVNCLLFMYAHFWKQIHFPSLQILKNQSNSENNFKVKIVEICAFFLYLSLKSSKIQMQIKEHFERTLLEKIPFRFCSAHYKV